MGQCEPQLSLPFSGASDGGSGSARPAEILTIAEAAERVRCCERTIRRAIDSGALRAGRILGEQGSRGAFRIRTADLDAWVFGDEA